VEVEMLGQGEVEVLGQVEGEVLGLVFSRQCSSLCSNGGVTLPATSNIPWFSFASLITRYCNNLNMLHLAKTFI